MLHPLNYTEFLSKSAKKIIFTAKPLTMSFEVVGKVIKKYETENKSGSFQAREFVIEVESGQYPQFVKFQLVQDRCALIDEYNEGDEIKVHFDLRGREWQGKYFTNLNAWRLERPAANSSPAPVSAAAPSAPVSSSADEISNSSSSGDMDDLPF
jgi:single-strand DNA-binding protein